jgi:two-component system response regulator MprA
MSICFPNTLHSNVELIHIVLIKQDSAKFQAIEAALCQQGYYVTTGEHHQLKYSTIQEIYPDLIILDGQDLNLPILDICRRLRATLNQVPIILLTNNNELSDSLTGFEAGADDCVAQPFKIEELLVRIRVRLHHAHKECTPILRFLQLALNNHSRKVYWNSQEINLTSKEFDVLQCLMLRRQKVVSRYDLVRHLWGTKDDQCSNVIDAYICRLRFKLERYGQAHLIQTVYGIGYILKEPF